MDACCVETKVMQEISMRYSCTNVEQKLQYTAYYISLNRLNYRFLIKLLKIKFPDPVKILLKYYKIKFSIFTHLLLEED